jgi:anti-anti-sigma factor
VLVLALAGRVAFASADTLAATVADAIAQGNRHLVIDLARVDYMSSAGLKALEVAAGRCSEMHGTLVLCALSEPVRIALDLAGLIPRFPIEASRDRAVAHARSTS